MMHADPRSAAAWRQPMLTARPALRPSQRIAAALPIAGGGDGTLRRMQVVVYGAVGHLSSVERPQYSAHLDNGDLSRLSESLLAWSKASGLDRDTFRERSLGGTGSDEVVDQVGLRHKH